MKSVFLEQNLTDSGFSIIQSSKEIKRVVASIIPLEETQEKPLLTSENIDEEMHDEREEEVINESKVSTQT